MAANAPVQPVPPDVACVRVAVAGAPPVTFCIDPEAGDPVATWFTDHDWIDEPVQRAFLCLVGPGTRVLDLGCHIGTFSLAAAALGAQVLAVDAAPEHVRLVTLAAACNRFNDLHVVHAAIADGVDGGTVGPRCVRFVVRSIHGHVLAGGEPSEEAIDVPVVTVDELLAQVGWTGVDVVKMDIEGCEVAALRGMRELFGRGTRPALVLESNSDMLERMGSSVVELRALVMDLGYEVLLIDHLRPGVLVEVGPTSIQTESASDVLAVRGRPGGLLEQWRVEPPPGREATICRLLDAAASPAPGYRRVAADLLRAGPAWLRDAGAVRAARAALDHDIDDAVRRGPGHQGRGRAVFDYADAPEPACRGAPDAVAIMVEGLSVAPRLADLERPFELPRPAEEAVLRDLFFHVNRGDAVALLSEQPRAATLLLDTLSGHLAPLDGELTVRGDTLSLASLSAGLEPGLTVEENALVLGAFLGGHVPSLEAALPELLETVGLAGLTDRPLHQAGAEAVVRLGLGVGLTCRQPAVLLIGDLPLVGDSTFLDWARGQLTALLAGGTAVVQIVRDRVGLLVEPRRALWLEAGGLRAAGHAASVFEEARLAQLGYRSVAGGWQEAYR